MRDRGVLIEPRDVLFAHLEIHCRNGPKERLAQQTDISLGDGLCLHDYIL